MLVIFLFFAVLIAGGVYTGHEWEAAGSSYRLGFIAGSVVYGLMMAFAIAIINIVSISVDTRPFGV